jgi:O-antigen ligase
MSIIPFLKMGPDIYLLKDFKNALYLSTLAFFLQTNIFKLKNLIKIFIVIILFSALYALICVFDYFNNFERISTWNEVFFGVSIPIGIILLNFIKEKKIRLAIIVSIIINFLGLLVTQTRGIWLSTLISIILYLFISIKGTRVSKLIKNSVIIGMSIFTLLIILELTLNLNVAHYVTERLSERQKYELINPYSSMGFRVYESYMVYKHRSLFGHGSGARLYMFHPLRGMWINWWYFHSEYFEMLHKYGYVGVVLLLIIIVLTLSRSFKMFIHPKKTIRTLGAISFCSLLSISIFSVTSGYLSRPNVMFLLLLIYGCTEKYYPVKRHRLKNRNPIY